MFIHESACRTLIPAPLCLMRCFVHALLSFFRTLSAYIPGLQWNILRRRLTRSPSPGFSHAPPPWSRVVLYST
ncbi:hypothetical protein JB92DRAFT_2917051 [Gautieria morchelliformis]|nr:hypothetical protein JB92DRAFT_2917051 [Gautieria morchelliformis]